MAATARAITENKRAVKDKDLGPLVKTVMTRCIHCTRCIRFCAEVAGTPEIGAHRPRREHGSRHLRREGADRRSSRGNLIDICPVGALTSQAPTPSSRARGNCEKTDGIDVLGRRRRQYPHRRARPRGAAHPAAHQ
jgi:NADH-quinone oxidoreductase subunit G